MNIPFSLTGLSPASDGTQLSSLLLPDSNTSLPSSSSTSIGNIGKGIGKVAGQAYNKISGSGYISQFFGVQAITGIVGFLLIIGGIFLFRPVRETVVKAAKTGATAAKIAAA